MTDRDVVARVADLFHRAVVATAPRQAHHKIPYLTTIKGAAAARMMLALAPLMSSVRQGQIERAIGAHHPVRRSAPELLVTDGFELTWEAAGPEARVAWLAGILEAEGSFLAARTGIYSYPQVQMTMCDRSVLERAMDLMPASRIYADIDKRGIERGWSEAWMVKLSGPPAASVMKAVLPWMGLRRTKAIERALSAWRPIRLAPKRESCIVPGCWRRHAARGLCNTHYMSWSRDRATGRVPRITPLR